MENLSTGLRVLAIIIIILGVLGSLAIVVSFDREAYDYAKENKIIYEEEYEVLKAELSATWVYASGILIGSLASGMVILALERIMITLEVIKNGGDTSKFDTM